MKIRFLLPDVSLRPIGGYKIVYDYASWLARNYPRHEVEVQHLTKASDGSIRSGLSSAVRRWDLRYRRAPAWAKLHPAVGFTRRNESDRGPECACDMLIATAWRTAEHLVGRTLSPSTEVRYFIQHFEDWNCDRERLLATWRAIEVKLFVAKWLFEICKENGIDTSRSAHVPNGIDLTVHRPVAVPRLERSVAMMYSSQPFKGGETGLAAMKIIAAKWPDASLTVFGTEKRPAGLPVGATYHRNPSRECLVRDIYSRSAVFMSTSSLEGWGLPGAEAMACGCALVSTDHRGVRDYATPDRNALIVTPGDAGAVAEAVGELLGSPVRCRELAVRGREHIQGFSLATAARHFWQMAGVHTE